MRVAQTKQANPPTFESVWATLDRIAKKQEEEDRKWEELRESQREEARKWEEFRKSQREEARKWEEFKKSQRESQRESQKEEAQKWEEFRKSQRERQEEEARKWEEFKKSQRESQRETDRIVQNVGKRMGYMDNRFGELAEHLVAPGIMEKFNKMGFNFTRCSKNVEIKDPNTGKINMEIDLLLENGDIVIAVEVKVKPNLKDIEEHIERMEKLRYDADKREDKRKYRGAIASPILTEDLHRNILRNGFYAIEQTGDTMKINVPSGFVAREF